VRVHFDNVLRPGTGPGTFAHRLARCLFKAGHQVQFHGSDADVSLVFIEPSGAPLAPKVVQRLDGIWFKPEEYESKNRHIKALYEKADAVIWQSLFDKKMSVFHWGDPGVKRTPFQGCVLPEPVDLVIGNGIELEPIKEITIPALASMRQEYERIFVCSSNWHAQKRLSSNVALFQRLRIMYPRSCLIIMGDRPDVMIADPHVFYTGVVEPEIYMQVYSVADWMLHLAWADHCPNVVVEALSQGTPVICSEVGGTKELVGNGAYGMVLKEEPYGFQLYDYDNPPVIDVSQVAFLPSRHDLDYKGIPSIDIRDVADRYVQLFERLCGQ